jgi:hypothetical protein
LRQCVSQAQFRSALPALGERKADSNALSLAETVGNRSKHTLTVQKFIAKEYYDRSSRNGLANATWNLLFFPITTAFNFWNYRKWLRLLDRLELDETALKEEMVVKVKSDNPTMKKFFNSSSVEQIPLHFNSCYVILQEAVFIFPKYSTSTSFYTSIEPPIAISLDGSTFPYQSVWGVPTFTKLISKETTKDGTRFQVKDRFDLDVQIEIKKKLLLPTPTIK